MPVWESPRPWVRVRIGGLQYLFQALRATKLRVEDDQSEEITTLDFTRTPAETNKAQTQLPSLQLPHLTRTEVIRTGRAELLRSYSESRKQRVISNTFLWMFRANVRIFIEANGSKTGSVDVTQFTVALFWRFICGAHELHVWRSSDTLGYYRLHWTRCWGSETLPTWGFHPIRKQVVPEPRQRFWMQCPEHTTFIRKQQYFQMPWYLLTKEFQTKYIRLLIIDEDDSTIAYTDLLSIKPTHKHTNLYSIRDKRFCRTDLRGHYPTPSFGIRVTSKFFKRRNPQEDERKAFPMDQWLNCWGTAKTKAAPGWTAPRTCTINSPDPPAQYNLSR